MDEKTDPFLGMRVEELQRLWSNRNLKMILMDEESSAESQRWRTKLGRQTEEASSALSPNKKSWKQEDELEARSEIWPTH